MILFDFYAVLDEIDKQASGSATSATSATIQQSDELIAADLAFTKQEITFQLEAYTRLRPPLSDDPQPVSQNIVSFDA